MFDGVDPWRILIPRFRQFHSRLQVIIDAPFLKPQQPTLVILIDPTAILHLGGFKRTGELSQMFSGLTFSQHLLVHLYVSSPARSEH